MGTTIPAGGAGYEYRVVEDHDAGTATVLAGPVIHDPDSGTYVDLDVVEVFRGDAARAAAEAWVDETVAEDRDRAMDAAAERARAMDEIEADERYRW